MGSDIEFKINDSVSQANSCAFNISNSSVVLNVWDVLHLFIRLVKMCIVEVYLVVIIVVFKLEGR